MNQKVTTIFKYLKMFIKETFVILWLVIIFVSIFAAPWTTSLYTSQIQVARDTTRLQDYSEIKANLESVKEYDFYSIDEYNQKYNTKIKDPKFCYYLSATEDKKWYLFAMSFESSKMKNKFWNDYFLYKSNENYVISTDKLKEIEWIIKKYNCNK